MINSEGRIFFPSICVLRFRLVFRHHVPVSVRYICISFEVLVKLAYSTETNSLRYADIASSSLETQHVLSVNHQKIYGCVLFVVLLGVEGNNTTSLVI